MKKVNVNLEVVGGLGAIATGVLKYLAVIRIDMKKEHSQKQLYWGQQEF